MEQNKHFYLKQVSKDLYVDVENGSVNVDAYVVLKKKTSNDWEGKQVWNFDEKEQIVNVQTGKIIGYLNRDPNTSNHYTLVQKDNKQQSDFQWVYDTSTKVIHSKQLGNAYNFGPHAGNAFDGGKICVEQGNPNPGPHEIFEVEYKDSN